MDDTVDVSLSKFFGLVTEREEGYANIWYMIFLWGLFTNLIVHTIAALIAFVKLRHHRLGRIYYPIFLVVMGIISSVTGIAVTSVVIAGIYRAANFVFQGYHAVVFGVLQTLVIFIVSLLRLPATL